MTMGIFKRSLAALGRFLKVVFRSCYDMEFYRAVRVRSWPQALRYFVAFNALAVLLTMFDLAPTTFIALGHVQKYIAEKIPVGATLSVRSGVLETSLPMPFNFGDDRTPLVIDTAVTGLDAQPDIAGEQGVVIGRDAVYIKKSPSDRQVMAMKEMPDFSASKDLVLGWLDSNGRWLAASAVIAFALMYFLVSLASGVVFVILASLLAGLFGALWRVRLRFRQWVAVGFHAVTLPTLINALFNEFGMTVPMVFTFLYFMIIVAVIADERAAPTSALAVVVAAAEGFALPTVEAAVPPAPKKRQAVRKAARPRMRRKKSASPPAEPLVPPTAPPPPQP
jgi:hypothetical protein